MVYNGIKLISVSENIENLLISGINNEDILKTTLLNIALDNNEAILISNKDISLSGKVINKLKKHINLTNKEIYIELSKIIDDSSENRILFLDIEHINNKIKNRISRLLKKGNILFLFIENENSLNKETLSNFNKRVKLISNKRVVFVNNGDIETIEI